MAALNFSGSAVGKKLIVLMLSGLFDLKTIQIPRQIYRI